MNYYFVDEYHEWKPVTGIASVAVGDPEPRPEWDRIGQQFSGHLRAFSKSYTAVVRTAGMTLNRFAKALDISLTPRPQRNNAMHRYGRRLSPMRTAYRAKTKNRRRKR